MKEILYWKPKGKPEILNTIKHLFYKYFWLLATYQKGYNSEENAHDFCSCRVSTPFGEIEIKVLI